MYRLVPSCLLAGLLTSSVSAQDPDEAARLARARARGALLYAYDRAAWHGTDDLRTKLPGFAQRVGGYIVDGPAAAAHLTFFDKNANRAVYVARFAGEKLIEGKVLGSADDHTLSPLDLKMIAALATARQAMAADRAVFACAPQPFNTVVLPPDTAEGVIAVYFLTPQTSNDAIPMGGHYEVDVDAAGRAGAVRPFSKSCIAAPTHPKLPKGAKPSMFFITSLLDSTPTEVHVFSSMALGLPIGVGTVGPPARLWPVTGTSIGAPVTLKR